MWWIKMQLRWLNIKLFPKKHKDPAQKNIATPEPDWWDPMHENYRERTPTHMDF